MAVLSIGDPVPIGRCPMCQHTYVFFDADSEPEFVDELCGCWAVCDSCLWMTPKFDTQHMLLEHIRTEHGHT